MRIPRRFQGFVAHSSARRVVGAGLIGVLCALAPGVAAMGDDRSFGFVYETRTATKGSIEYEQWVTWSTHKAEDTGYDRFEFRHELEFGITDHLQLGLYVVDWQYEDGGSVEDDGIKWNDVAGEVIFNMSDPGADILGSALYGEVRVGDQLLVLEGKILLQKIVGKFNFAYNASLEAAWEGDGLEERTGEFEQSLGVSFEVSPRLYFGAEAVQAIEMPEWSRGGKDEVYVGPNVSYRTEKWWITATPLIQATDNDEAADFKLRVLIGFDF